MAKKDNESITFAFIATFLSVIGFIIALLSKREDKYVMFYAKQSLVIFAVWVFISILQGFFELIMIFGKIVNIILGALVVALWAISWVYALSGKKKEVPVVGIYGRKLKL